jgi:hypothetical protein
MPAKFVALRAKFLVDSQLTAAANALATRICYAAGWTSKTASHEL